MKNLRFLMPSPIFYIIPQKNEKVCHIVRNSSSDEQNIFCLYKERFFWLFTHCICLIVLKKPHFPSFPFYAPFFFPLSPLITSFLQLYTNLTCIFSSNSVPFSFIRLFFHALSRSRCFCFLLCFTFFHNLSHASMICAIMCPICMR